MEPSQILALQSIDRLLACDAWRFAALSSTRLAGGQPRLEPDDTPSILGRIDTLSRHGDDTSSTLAVMLGGLLVENLDGNGAGIRPALDLFYRRAGIAPLADTLWSQGTHEVSAPHVTTTGSLLLDLVGPAYDVLHTVSSGARGQLVLTDFQLRLWNQLHRSDRVAVTAPTSAGKSFVLTEYVAEVLQKSGGPIVYIVPTISLIRQVSRDIRKALVRRGRVEVSVHQVLGAQTVERDAVYVLTQERTAGALAALEDLGSIRLLIVDEVQNIERVANEPDERSQTLVDVATRLIDTVEVKQAILAGPRLSNPAEVGEFILREKPTVVSDGGGMVASVIYSISSKKAERRLVQRLVGLDKECSYAITDDLFSTHAGKKQYTPAFLKSLATSVKGLASDGGVLIFAPTSQQAAKTAVALAKATPLRPESAVGASLSAYLRSTVHQQYGLASAVRRGFGYHHGKTPSHARVLVERLFGSELIKALVCTTTLMQGVNLPARYLIARNASLFVKRQRGEAPTLTTYEFSNLVGRAGRLRRELVGRVFVLDDEACVDADVEIGATPSRDVAISMRDRYLRNRASILNLLRGSAIVTAGTNAADIVTRVRRLALTEPEDFVERLDDVGISIEPDTVASLGTAVRSLTVPVEVIDRCRFWDPFALQAIHDRVVGNPTFTLPESAFSRRFENWLESSIRLIREVAPYYTERYLGNFSEKEIYSLVKMSTGWARGESTASLINWPSSKVVDEVEVERRLARLHSKVQYNVPRVVEPIAAMASNADSGLLLAMEVGATRSTARALIEAGVPREVAIVAADQFRRVRSVPRGTRPNIGDVARAVWPYLNEWERLILEDAIDINTPVKEDDLPY